MLLLPLFNGRKINSPHRNVSESSRDKQKHTPMKEDEQQRRERAMMRLAAKISNYSPTPVRISKQELSDWLNTTAAKN